MSTLLLVLATAVSAEALLTLQPERCVRLIAGTFFCVGVFLSILCIIDPRVALLYAVVCAALCARKFKWYKAVPAAIVLMVALVLNLLPGSQELLYLSVRYADSFNYIGDGVCRSSTLDCNVVVSVKEGDTYQSSLYSRQLITSCSSCLPIGTEVLSAYVEKQQTTYLATSYEDYVRVMNPTVHIEARLPEGIENNIEFPVKCILDTVP